MFSDEICKQSIRWTKQSPPSSHLFTLRTKTALFFRNEYFTFSPISSLYSTLFTLHPYYARWCYGSSLSAFFLLQSGLNRRREGIYCSVTPNCLPPRTLSENLNLFPLKHLSCRDGSYFINGGCPVAAGDFLWMHKWAACWLSWQLRELCTKCSFIFWAHFKNTFFSSVRSISCTVHGRTVYSF